MYFFTTASFPWVSPFILLPRENRHQYAACQERTGLKEGIHGNWQEFRLIGSGRRAAKGGATTDQAPPLMYASPRIGNFMEIGK